MNNTVERQNELIDLISNAKNGFTHYEKQFKELEAIYLGEMDDQLKLYLEEREKSALFFNKAQAKSRRISDQINKAYFSNDNFASLDSVDEKYADVAEKLEKASKDYLRNANIFLALQEGIYKLPYIGTIVARSYWGSKGYTVEGVALEHFWFDPDSSSQSDTRYVVHEVFLAIEDVERLQEAGVFSKDINIRELVSEDEAGGYTRLSIKEIYTRDNEDNWSVSSVYDDTYFFRIDDPLTDGLPFNWGGCLAQVKKINEGTFVTNYYEPILASIKTLQEEYNVRRNQVIDGIKQQLNPKKIVNKNSGINPIEAEKPTGLLQATQPTAIQIIPPADVRGAMNDVAIIDQDMSELSGVSPMMSGVSNDKNKTATEKGIEHSEGSLKLEIFIRNLNETFFEPLLKRAITLIYKYADDRYFIGVDRSRDMPKMNITFDVGLGVTNDVVRTQQISQNIANMNGLFQMAMAIQDMDEAKLIYEATKKLTKQLMPLGGIKNVDDYLPEKDEEELGNGSINNIRDQGVPEQPMLEVNPTMDYERERGVQIESNGF